TTWCSAATSTWRRPTRPRTGRAATRSPPPTATTPSATRPARPAPGGGPTTATGSGPSSTTCSRRAAASGPATSPRRTGCPTTARSTCGPRCDRAAALRAGPSGRAGRPAPGDGPGRLADHQLGVEARDRGGGALGGRLHQQVDRDPPGRGRRHGDRGELGAVEPGGADVVHADHADVLRH